MHGGTQRFFTGASASDRNDPPQLPGSAPTASPARRDAGKPLSMLGYNTGEFGKNHLGDHTDVLPTAHGFEEFWGYLYHLDAMQGVSFPVSSRHRRNRPLRHLAATRRSLDLLRTQRRSIPGRPPSLTPPRPVLASKIVDEGPRRQSNLDRDEDPLTPKRSKYRGRSMKCFQVVIDFLDGNDRETQKPFFVWHNPTRMHITTMLSDKYRRWWRTRRQGLGCQRSRHEATR